MTTPWSLDIFRGAPKNSTRLADLYPHLGCWTQGDVGRMLNKDVFPSLQRLIITHKSSAGHRRMGQPEGKAKSPPWQRRVAAPSSKWSRSFGGAARSVSPVGRNIKNGVVRSTSDNRWLEPTTPSAPAKEASRHFLNGRSHPTFSKEGTSPFPPVVPDACVPRTTCA